MAKRNRPLYGGDIVAAVSAVTKLNEVKKMISESKLSVSFFNMLIPEANTYINGNYLAISIVWWSMYKVLSPTLAIVGDIKIAGRQSLCCLRSIWFVKITRINTLPLVATYTLRFTTVYKAVIT